MQAHCTLYILEKLTAPPGLIHNFPGCLPDDQPTCYRGYTLIILLLWLKSSTLRFLKAMLLLPPRIGKIGKLNDVFQTQMTTSQGLIHLDSVYFTPFFQCDDILPQHLGTFRCDGFPTEALLHMVTSTFISCCPHFLLLTTLDVNRI